MKLPTYRILLLSMLLCRIESVTWIRQPTDQNVTIGGNVIFPCEVQDPNNNLTKVWNKGTTPIFINGVRAYIPDRYSITGENTLVIRNVELADDAFYICTIFTFDSVQVKLTVLKSVTWIRQPTDQNVTKGGNVIFPCEVQDPNNNLTKIWNKGTTPIFINGVHANIPDRYSIIGENTLVIRNVELADDSFYTCSIFTFDSVQVKLTVLMPPEPPAVI